MRLTLDLYGIHGTNIPWGVGMLVSHGCVRLYPEDIEKLYPLVPVGTQGVFVYQPIKVGMADGRVYVEVHKDLYGMKPGMYRETRAMLEQHGFMSLVDEEKLREAVLAQSGIPVDVTGGSAARADRRRSRRRAPTCDRVRSSSPRAGPHRPTISRRRACIRSPARSTGPRRAHAAQPAPVRRPAARQTGEGMLPPEIVLPSGATVVTPTDSLADEPR